MTWEAYFISRFRNVVRPLDFAAVRLAFDEFCVLQRMEAAR